jgi:hypothetical protein
MYVSYGHFVKQINFQSSLQLGIRPNPSPTHLQYPSRYRIMILANTLEYCDEGVAMLFDKSGFYLCCVISIHERNQKQNIKCSDV